MTVVTRDGVRLSYAVEGAGPALFFHTGGGGDGSMWRTAGYVDLLPGFRHVMFDHRGHGAGDGPTALEQHRLEEYVADVLAVLDAEGIPSAHYVGYSSGAYVGCALAARAPQRVSSLVLIGGVAHPDDDQALLRGRAAAVRAEGVGAVIRRMSDSEEQPAPGWFVDNLASTSTEMFALGLEGWADAPNQTRFFADIRCPTLIVCGERETTDGSAALAVAALPDGRSAVIPGFGHLQVFWRSDVTGPLVADFLAGLRSRPAGRPAGR